MSIEAILQSPDYSNRLRRVLSEGIYAAIAVNESEEDGVPTKSIEFVISGATPAVQKFNDNFLYRLKHGNPEVVSSIIEYDSKIAKNSGTELELFRLIYPPEAHVCLGTIFKATYYSNFEKFVTNFGLAIGSVGLAYAGAHLGSLLNNSGVESDYQNLISMSLGIVGVGSFIYNVKSALNHFDNFVKVRVVFMKSAFSRPFDEKELRISNRAYMHVEIPEHLREYYPN